MWDHKKQLWTVIILGNILLHSIVSATPVYAPQFLPGGTGRNIRHLPCVSRRTGETGVCMFAFTCAKANGTHLGTCIDRFYFGSCCKIGDEPDIFPQDNTIEDGPSLSRPYATTQGPIESNDIPEYVSRPKPIVEKKPSTLYTTVNPSDQTTQSITTSTKETTKTQTKKPIITTESTTESVRLTTFQTVQNASEESTTVAALQKNITIANTSPPKHSSTSNGASTTIKPAKPSSTAEKPVSAENVTKLPSTLQTFSYISKPTTKKPIPSSNVYNRTQTTTKRPPQSTTTKSVSTTTQKLVPATRFPPRNVTTPRPSTQITTRKPPVTVTKRPVGSSTRKPLVTTKKPSSPTKRPASPTKPSSTSTTNTKPTSGVTFTGKPTNDSMFATTTTSGSTIGTKPTSTPTPGAKPTTSSTFGSKPFTTSVHGTKPITRPTTSATFATERPALSTTEKTRPTPVKVKPTVIASTITSKPLILGNESTTSVNQPTTTTTTSGESISDNIITTDRLTTNKPVVTTTTRPKITSTTIRITTKPTYTSSAVTTQKTEPLLTTSGASVETVKPKPTEKPAKPTNPSIAISSATPASTLATSSTLASVVNETTPINVESSKIPVANGTAVNTAQTTYPPGLVTWTSDSVQITTKSPEVLSTNASQEVQTASEWTPITSPDGWVIIQTPTTEKPQIQEASTPKPVEEPTQRPPTTAQPTTESPTTEYVTKRTTVATLLSTIASVTIDPELPVPMETLNMSDYKLVCGRRLFPESRIVGGERSTFGKWPWQISLRQWKTSTYLHKCGAALLNENWAITAAHCVENVPPSDLLLRIGEHDLANEEEPYGYQERRVQIVASHPQFDPRTFEYDLALLRFYEPLLPFQPNVLPICLPDDDETYVGRTAYVTGWGRLYDDGPLPSVLQEVSVPVINNTVCEAMYKNAGYIEHIPHIFICAGWRNGGFDSCEGDSGGPMVIQRARDKRWILAGVISWGIGCAVPNQPGVYTRISEFREWINQILQF